MKANELMIGDWVLSKSISKPARVEGISMREGAGHDGYTFILRDKNNTALYIRAISVEPIPLTPEILERNGFRYNDMPFVQGWEQFGLTLYHGGKGYLINCGINVALEIGSVHELQHVLRLCGIEKEIII